MLSLSRKVDYALVALAHLLENPDQVASARVIAQAHGLPVPLMMNILKRLHQAGLLQSTRGMKGGYRIAVNLDRVSLARLIEVMQNPDGICEASITRRLSIQPPVQALQFKLIGFLEDVKLSDLLKPGRRIDVPLEWLERARDLRATVRERESRPVQTAP
jgi:Rrf2 family protein